MDEVLQSRKSESDSRRWAFLAGEGSLTSEEIAEWAIEYGGERVLLPNDDDGTTALMVALVNPDALNPGGY